MAYSLPDFNTLDVRGPCHVEIELQDRNSQGLMVYVNINGITALRISSIERIQLTEFGVKKMIQRLHE